MGRSFRAGLCVAAFAVSFVTDVEAKGHAARCAQPSEVSAIQTASIQQELMVSALTCDLVAKFNNFQTSFGPELRAADRTLLRMFQRLYGGGKGQAEYHAFKTRLANNSEMRSIHGNHDFCTAAGLVFEAALAPLKPRLPDFVAGVQVQDASPVNSCQIQVALGLQGAMAAAPNVVPRIRPADLGGVPQTAAPTPPPASAPGQ